ncbi:MAG: hypothetical protein ACOZNI_21085 [Myxococcota bacterium]
MIALTLALSGEAAAQACVCARNVALPTGAVTRPGEGVFSLDYGIGLSGDTTGWRGFSVTDLHGDSMAGMYMPPHVVNSATLNASVGLPAGFSITGALPWIDIRHAAPSEMPGDVDSSSLADASVGVRWGWVGKDKRTFVGAQVGATLPTGKVVEDTPVRAGKGAVGGLLGLQASRKVSARTALLAAAGATPTLFVPPDGYVVGSGGNIAIGARWSPRENGRVSFTGLGLLQVQGTDRQDALVYRNTGSTAIDASLGAGWNVWGKGDRSVTLVARVQVPVWQVVGDPMYAENVSMTTGVNVVAF